MAQATITFRIDEEMKEELNGICEALGLTLSGALTIFAKKMINERGLPFDLKLNPNYETIKTMKEVEENKGLSKTFTSVNELMEDLNA